MPSDTKPLIDFLNSVPPTLTVALLQLAPCISVVRHAIEVLTWSGRTWQSSWLVVAAWWASCLLLDTTLRCVMSSLCCSFLIFCCNRRFLPLFIFGLLAIWRWRRKPRQEEPPVTETTLQTVVTDLTIIQSSLPNSIPAPSLELPKAFRAAVILSIPYLLFSFFVSFRVVIAIAGTILLTWRAPWAVLIRATVWRSAWFRWTVYRTWAFLTSQPLPPLVMSPKPAVPSSEAIQSVRFLFTIYENQRWWMGLDWTAALLPAERPSWCSAAQQPMSPPNSFTLPESTTVCLPDGKGGKLKRTATWRWEEPEWRVIVHKERNTVSRVERPLPTLKDDNQNNSLLLKAAGRLRNGSQSDSNKAAAADDRVSEDVPEPDEEVLTDSDGWVYTDNTWENQSNKGGMGKVSVDSIAASVSFLNLFLFFSIRGIAGGRGLR